MDRKLKLNYRNFIIVSIIISIFCEWIKGNIRDVTVLYGIYNVVHKMAGYIACSEAIFIFSFICTIELIGRAGASPPSRTNSMIFLYNIYTSK